MHISVYVCSYFCHFVCQHAPRNVKSSLIDAQTETQTRTTRNTQHDKRQTCAMEFESNSWCNDCKLVATITTTNYAQTQHTKYICTHVHATTTIPCNMFTANKLAAAERPERGSRCSTKSFYALTIALHLHWWLFFPFFRYAVCMCI